MKFYEYFTCARQYVISKQGEKEVGGGGYNSRVGWWRHTERPLFGPLSPSKRPRPCAPNGICTATSCAAVWETILPPSLETSRLSQQYGIEGFKVFLNSAPIMPRGSRLSASRCKFCSLEIFCMRYGMLARTSLGTFCLIKLSLTN